MWYGEREVVTNLLTVNEDRGLDVRTFEEEGDATTVVERGRHEDSTTIPSATSVVAVGRQEERELHLTSLAVLLHVGIEIETGVVERARPLRLCGNDVTLAVGEHRTREEHVVVVRSRIVEGQVPGARQRDGLRSYAAK